MKSWFIKASEALSPRSGRANASSMDCFIELNKRGGPIYPPPANAPHMAEAYALSQERYGKRLVAAQLGSIDSRLAREPTSKTRASSPGRPSALTATLRRVECCGRNSPFCTGLWSSISLRSVQASKPAGSFSALDKSSLSASSIGPPSCGYASVASRSQTLKKVVSLGGLSLFRDSRRL